MSSIIFEYKCIRYNYLLKDHYIINRIYSNLSKETHYLHCKSKDFNLYDLDKTTGKWIEKGKDSISVFNKNKVYPPVPPMPIIATENAFKMLKDIILEGRVQSVKILFCDVLRGRN